MERVYNFSSGPAVIAEEVLQKAADEMLNYGGSGMSVMEMSHRSKVYQEIIDQAEALLRKLMNIPDDYSVLFLQGGASLQFAMLPLNLANKNNIIDIIMTGMWASRAKDEAEKYCRKVNVVASSKDKVYSYIPKFKTEDLTPEADYIHVCWNNTIYGTHFTSFPDTNGVPIVADMSSCILSEEYDVSKFGVIMAGAQKNMGPAGLTVVIIKKDLIGSNRQETPTMLRYDTHINNGSMYNTPPTYAIYMCKLVLEWLEAMGGIPVMEERNKRKAAMLYEYLDNSRLFRANVSGQDRSLMNVPFVTGNEDIDKDFIEKATKAGFVNLKGHRSVGGMRASIYNAMPEEGVKALIDFMKNYESGR